MKSCGLNLYPCFANDKGDTLKFLCGRYVMVQNINRFLLFYHIPRKNLVVFGPALTNN